MKEPKVASNNRTYVSISLTVITFLIFGAIGFYLYYSNQNPSELSNAPENLESIPSISEQLILDQNIVEEFQLTRLDESTGLEGLNETTEYVEEEQSPITNEELATEQISYYQTYVTPNDPAVISIAQGKTPEQIYQTALSWVWVEDEIINGEVEMWLLPNIFLTQTPNFPTNPVQGMIASDCESQAYTLVSALRAGGMAPENVRVVTGLVNFGGGNAGGHAWVEVFDQVTNSWFALEATSGNYYNSSTGELQTSNGLNYNYFKFTRYPSVQIWNYFNDAYFYDLGRNEGIVPDNWFIEQSLFLAPDLSEITYKLPDELRSLRDERINAFKEQVQERRNEINQNIDSVRQQIDEQYGDVTQEDIQEEALNALDELESLVEQGLTDTQQEQIKTQADQSIQTAYELVEQSNLSEDEKAELNAYLAELETYLDTGLTPAQKALLQASLLASIDNIEDTIESGEVQDRVQETLDGLRGTRDM